MSGAHNVKGPVMSDLDAVRARIANCRSYNFGMRDADHLAHVDAPALLDRLERAEKVIEDVMVSHRPAHPVFNWALGLRYDEPCPDCNGKAGVHECGCWADEDIEFVCRECDDPKGGKSRREVPWPCDVARILSGYEKEGS